jgi:hypothetical protein
MLGGALGLIALHAWAAVFLYACIGTLWGNLAERSYAARMRPAVRSWLMPGRLRDRPVWIRFQKTCAALALPLVLVAYGIALMQLLHRWSATP